MVEKMTFAEVAEKVGISPDKVRHWVKSLRIEPAKIRGICYLEPRAVQILEEMKRGIASGLSPAGAAALVRSKPEATTPIPIANTLAVISSEVSNRLEAMEKAIMLLVDENRSLRSEVAELRKDSTGPRLPLESPPVEIPKPAPRRPDPGMVICRKIEEKPLQRDAVSAWEGIRLAFDDLLGFAFGRG